MTTREPTALTRELGNELKSRRLASGIKADELAVKMQWSPTKISRVESGQRFLDEIELVFYLAHCGAKKQDLDELLPLCRDIGRGFWLKERLRSLIFHESRATAHQQYEPLVMPGLLQTEDYARALIKRHYDHTDATRKLEVRMRRQRILEPDWGPIDAAFYIHEQVLDLPVGGDRVMNEQLLQLVLMSDRPNVSIRVVPRDLGERSMFGGPFAVYYYREHGPLVYQENGVSGLFIDDIEYVFKCQGMMTALAQVALGGEESRVLLATMASRYDRLDSNDPDHLAEEHPQQ
jgi:transcriptional regulator with XRE-family HTH domain